MEKKPLKINAHYLVVACIDCQDILLAGNAHLVECKETQTDHSMHLPLCKECGKLYKQDTDRLNKRIELMYLSLKEEIESMDKE